MIKKFITEFKEFAIQGNAVDLAVGVVIGAAFKAIVDAIVNDVLNPLIGLIGGDVAKFVVHVGKAELNIGDLIGAIINFFLIALVLFIFIKASNKFKKKRKEEEAAAPAEPSEEIKLLTEIRDSLKK